MNRMCWLRITQGADDTGYTMKTRGAIPRNLGSEQTRPGERMAENHGEDHDEQDEEYMVCLSFEGCEVYGVDEVC